VADTGCLSRILIFIHTGLRISDPGSNITERGEGRNFLSYFFVSTNIKL
jgi:hypothetical protein